MSSAAPAPWPSWPPFASRRCCLVCSSSDAAPQASRACPSGSASSPAPTASRCRARPPARHPHQRSKFQGKVSQAWSTRRISCAPIPAVSGSPQKEIRLPKKATAPSAPCCARRGLYRRKRRSSSVLLPVKRAQHVIAELKELLLQLAVVVNRAAAQVGNLSGDDGTVQIAPTI